MPTQTPLLAQVDNALLERIRKARHLVVFTGAGVSAESGIPTFRDAQTGLWSRFDATELATPEAFQADPALVWGWYEWRRMKVLQAEPNSGHYAIARMEQHIPQVTVITQNVDDLHERAGSQNVLHLHGSLHQPRCFDCATPYQLDSVPTEPEGGRRLPPPLCPVCGGAVRPGVVWFGEALPTTVLPQAFEAAASCDVLLSVGTSSLVQPAAQIPFIAQQHGAAVAHINTQPIISKHSDDWMLLGVASVLLPKLETQAFSNIRP
ncbi:NAD-dependent deacetylase [Pseudomonas duriflava]|uniref:NAD-dependent protein deacylase n=1 Tax=Pseudomonas duriflava TaxID=459528 RepID=A0A562QPM1_9PSED|nr:NAD-dependent deacylase [Pseudomonas duriflava]TWI58645.1 NAD-dependent deacetylase [Pseudomonas duriflava]